MREILAARAMALTPHSDDASAWPASLRFEHGVFESRYQVLRRLSDGGMGEVVLAEHLSLGKRVAIKIMHPQYRGDEATEERFILETRAAARIHHENVVGISDFGRTADGRMFFVMEYLEGEDLAQTLKHEGPLPWKRVVHMTRHVCRGIGEAHRQGVIHRDVKPGNCIRVNVDGDPDFIKVVDFGLAKLFGPRDLPRAPQTIAGVMLGTPGYMAPEIEAGMRPDPRVDLYSIGALMIRLLTGKMPDEGGIRALREMHELPPVLLKLLHKALREDPDERFQSAAAMEEALDYVMLSTARPPSLRSVKARPVTANKLQAPQPVQARAGGASAPMAAARPVTGRSHERPGAAEERPTRAIHSGALMGRTAPAPMQVMASEPEMSPRTPVIGERAAVPVSVPMPVPIRPRSRSWVALVSLGVGLLFGVAVAVWMHMSQETAAPVVPEPVVPARPVVVAPAVVEPVKVAEPQPVVTPPASSEPKSTKKASKRKRERSAASSDLKDPFAR